MGNKIKIQKSLIEPKYFHSLLSRNPRGLISFSYRDEIEADLWALLKDGGFMIIDEYVRTSKGYDSDLFTCLGIGIPIGIVYKHGDWDANMKKFFKNYPQYREKFEEHLKNIEKQREEYEKAKKNNP